MAARGERRTRSIFAENLLDRQFYAAKPNEKWLTDVTEFKWFEGVKVQKALSERHPSTFAIGASCPYVLSERNDNPLVSRPLIRL